MVIRPQVIRYVSAAGVRVTSATARPTARDGAPENSIKVAELTTRGSPQIS